MSEDKKIKNVHQRIYSVIIPGYEDYPILIIGMDSLNNFMKMFFDICKDVEYIRILDTTKGGNTYV